MIRFGLCKRSADKLVADLVVFDGHIQRFLDQFPAYKSWSIELRVDGTERSERCAVQLEGQGRMVQGLTDLIAGL